MRGVEAPFQLVVSVVAMVMVLALAYMVLQNAQVENCQQKWDVETSKIASAFSTVINGSAPTKFSVKFDFRCGESAEYELRFVRENDERKCLRVCGAVGPKGCAMVELRVTSVRTGGTLGVSVKCVEGASSYVPTKDGACDDGEDVTDELFSGGLTLERPYGILVIRRLLGRTEPINVCMR